MGDCGGWMVVADGVGGREVGGLLVRGGVGGGGADVLWGGWWCVWWVVRVGVVLGEL